jgi:nucleoside-diphosphate-sugar epimerase
MAERKALVVGATGIIGNNLARHLIAQGWDVHGLSHRRPTDIDRVSAITVDLMDERAVRDALAGIDVTHVFFTTWSRQETEHENCRVNAAMVRHALEAVESAPGLSHVALVTGLKHYQGPFDAYGVGKPETPFREDSPRLEFENFYYAQEDEVFVVAERRGLTWSVHRPHTIIGWAIGNAMNMGVTLAVYGTICRETGAPFEFPGTPEQWNFVTDVTDARLLAKHLEWAATTPQAANTPFNVVNGDVFRWRRMWGVVAAGLGVDPAPDPGEALPLEVRMRDAGPIWARTVERHGLVDYPVDTLASWWHSDLDLGRDAESFTDMTNSRIRGFSEWQQSDQSFLDLFDKLRAQRIIPSLAAMPKQSPLI